MSRRLTQRDVAAAAGIDVSYLSKIENDRLAPPASETIARIAQTLGDPPEKHLNEARKVPVTLRNSIERYPPEATEIIRALGSRAFAPSVYHQLLATLRAAGGDSVTSYNAGRERRKQRRSTTGPATSLALRATRVPDQSGQSSTAEQRSNRKPSI